MKQFLTKMLENAAFNYAPRIACCSSSSHVRPSSSSLSNVDAAEPDDSSSDAFKRGVSSGPTVEGGPMLRYEERTNETSSLSSSSSVLSDEASSSLASSDDALSNEAEESS